MIIYKPLTPAELLKPGRENRISAVFKKIKAKSPFLLLDGNSIILKEDIIMEAAATNAFNNRNSAVLSKIRFIGTDNKEYKFADLAKSKEFGGKGAGSGTVAEDEALTDIKNKLQTILLQNNLPYISLKIGSKTADVTDVLTTPGFPKSDFHFIDKKGKEVFWISHKKGNKAKDFQQYGGMVELKDITEVLNFANEIIKMFPDKRFPLKTAYARKVSDRNVIMKTLYGKDFTGSKGTSNQNIDVLHQGFINIEKHNNYYELTSNHVQLHGTIPSGEYEPWYYVRPEQAKNQFGLTGARFFIVAKQTALSNKNTIQI